MIQEVKVTLFCEEAIQHCHFHRLHSGNAPGPLAKDRYRLGIYGFQPKTTSLLNRMWQLFINRFTIKKQRNRLRIKLSRPRSTFPVSIGQ
jgi:hypothetical protein